MSDRMNTLVCIFDPSSPRISAYNIHEWIHEALRLMEEDTQVIQVDGPRCRVFIRFYNEYRMNEILQDTKGACEYKHDNGEISQVVVEIAGLGIKRFRLAGLPPEVEVTIKENLSKYEDIVNIRDEMWASAYRYKVHNGLRIVEIKLKQHMPSNLTIVGNDVMITYYGQPPTCYRCNEPGHQKIDCPQRQRLAPRSLGQRSTWADIVSNTTRDTHQKVLTKQPEGEIECRLESHSRLEHKSMTPDKHEQAQGTREQGN